MSTSKNLFSGAGFLGSDARRPAVYMEVHEDARTTLTQKSPAKKVFRGAQLAIAPFGAPRRHQDKDLKKSVKGESRQKPNLPRRQFLPSP